MNYMAHFSILHSVIKSLLLISAVHLVTMVYIVTQVQCILSYPNLGYPNAKSDCSIRVF